MIEILDGKKIFVLLLILSLIVASVFIYQNYAIKSVTTDDTNVPSSTGNREENENIEEDVGFPNTICLSGPNDIINYNNVTFTWTGTDDITATEDLLYSYRLEGKTSTWSPWGMQTSKTYTNLPDGHYTFFVKAKDRAGNIDLIPVEKLFIISITEGPETYYIYWPLIEKNFPFNDTLFADKKQPFIKTIKILQDNLKNITFELVWKDDLTSPLLHLGKDTLTLSIKAPNGTKLFEEESIEEGTLLFTKSDINARPSITSIEAENLSIAQNMSKQYYNTDWNNESIQIEVRIKIGEIRLLRRLRDKGNGFKLKISYEYYELQVSEVKDNPPDTTITSGPSGTVNKHTVDFSWKGTDDITPIDQLLYSYKLENFDTKWSPWTTKTTKTYTDLAEGGYTFFVKAKDHRENIDSTPAQRSFTIDIDEGHGDTKPPDTSILAGPTGVINYSTVTFNWTGSDDVTPTERLKYKYKLENYDDWSPWTFSTTTTYNNLPNAEYTFKVKARDEAGNEDPTPAKRLFTVNVGGGEPNRFATRVVEFSGSGNTDLILGGPRGAGPYQGSLHVLSLGNSGSVIVGFNVTVVNGVGEDFIIFENPFFENSSQDRVFAELVYVEISTDNIHFARFPSISTTAGPVDPYEGIDPENVTGLAGVWPVLANVDTNEINPFNPDEAGGDAFDLDDLVDDPLVQSGLVDLQDINYIKLIDILGDGSCLDSLGNPIYDPTGPGNNGADIDSIAIINYARI